jgi:plastocyanin
MPRRITVLLAAVVGVALCGFMVGTAGAAPAKKKLTILGKTTFKPGQFAKDTQRFTPKNLTVSPGDKVVLRNKAKTQDPHTISLVRKRQLPDSFECPACDAIRASISRVTRSSSRRDPPASRRSPSTSAPTQAPTCSTSAPSTRGCRASSG